MREYPRVKTPSRPGGNTRYDSGREYWRDVASKRKRSSPEAFERMLDEPLGPGLQPRRKSYNR